MGFTKVIQSLVPERIKRYQLLECVFVRKVMLTTERRKQRYRVRLCYKNIAVEIFVATKIRKIRMISSILFLQK